MKKFTIICLLFSLVLTGCAGVSKKETKKLKWVVFDHYDEMGMYQRSLNEMLEKKGLPYEIEFVNIKTNFEGDYKACVDSHLNEVKTGTYDIITCPYPLGCYDLYTMMADEGILLPITDFLEEDGAGEKLKEAYPSVVWKVMDYKGEIYGIPTPNMELNYYAVFNREYADKYGLDLSQVTVAELGESFQAVHNGEMRGEDEDPFVVTAQWPTGLGGTFEFAPCLLICIDTGGERPVAENILYKEEFLEHFRRLGDWGQKGFFSETDWEAMEKGEFLVTGTYAYSPEAAENFCRRTSNIPADIKLQVVELPEFSIAFYRRGCKTGVKKDGSDPEGILEVLAAIYSDEELSNALVYGKEGVDYQVKDGRAIGRGGDWGSEYSMTSDLGNPFLTMPGIMDSVSKKKELWQLAETVPLAVRGKISFDISRIDQEICQLDFLYFEKYRDYFMGIKDIETVLEDIRRDAEAAGIEKVLSELNDQLKSDG